MRLWCSPELAPTPPWCSWLGFGGLSCSRAVSAARTLAVMSIHTCTETLPLCRNNRHSGAGAELDEPHSCISCPMGPGMCRLRSDSLEP